MGDLMIGSIIGLMAAALASSSDAAPLAGPSPADTPPASSAPAPAKVKKIKDPGDKIVCHDDAITGSHLGGIQVCKKQKEWDAITNSGQEMLNSTNRMQWGYKPPSG